MIPILDRKLPRSKNKEWHGFISEEDENMYKNNELKNICYHFAKKLSTIAVHFHCHAITEIINRKPTNGKS